MKPLITALVDTYNHERYIEQALVSVLDQGLSPAELEIVVVDDGSTDKTPDIIQKFTPRVKHVRKQNGGQASAFNVGFSEAHGEAVAILDGDDWWAKAKLAAVTDALENHPEIAAVGHGYYEFHEGTGETQARVPERQMYLDLKNREAAYAATQAWHFFLMGALAVRRKVWDAIAPLPEELGFMADTPIQAAAMAMGTLILREPLFYYRHHPQNLFAIDSQNVASLRRKYDMADAAYTWVAPMLRKLQVPEDVVSELLGAIWAGVRRSRLIRFGGTRLEAFQTEMQMFRANHRDASLPYRLFNYLTIGTGTLLLPPQRFYQLRDWYAGKGLRNRLVRASE
jgi:glycosyltransferase involved in cell wall biosynthesis